MLFAEKRKSTIFKSPAASRFLKIVLLKGDLRNTKEDFLKMFHAQHPFQENIRFAGITHHPAFLTSLIIYDRLIKVNNQNLFHSFA